MNLRASVRDWAIENMPYDRRDDQIISYLKNAPLCSLIIKILNWNSRFISVKPRNVHLSKSIMAKCSDDIKPDLMKIIYDIELGVNLRRYLSHDVLVAFESNAFKVKGRRKRANIDFLLNDWGIHHLHISTKISDDGFVRSKNLLFALFKSDDAYLIDIGVHGDWVKEHLVRILHEEFPESGGTFVLSGITGAREGFSEKDRWQLRNSGVTTAVTVKGKFVVAGGGITSAGTALAITIKADLLLKKLDDFEKLWLSNPERVQQASAEVGIPISCQPNFSFTIDSVYGPSIFEDKSKLIIPLDI